MKWHYLVLNGIALAFMAGCGSYSRHVQDGPNIGPVDSVPLKQDLVGSWAGKCRSKGNTSVQRVFRDSSSGKIYSYQREFANSTCKGESVNSNRKQATAESSENSIAPLSANYAYGAIHLKSGRMDADMDTDIDAYISQNKMETWDRSGHAGDESTEVFKRINN